MSQELGDKLSKKFEELTKIKCKVKFLSKGVNHRATTLKENKKGVYVFFLNENICFKVGKANSNSQARWNSQHYSLDKSTPSTFTKSILSNLMIMKKYFEEAEIKKFENILKEYNLDESNFKQEIKKLDKTLVKELSNKLNLREWIQNNMNRIEFILDNNTDNNLDTNLLEALVQFELNPIFEG